MTIDAGEPRSAEEALNEYCASTGLLPRGSTRSDWYRYHVIPIKFGGVTVAAFPILQREGPIVLHDLHHMLLGCAPDWGGEAELAGWELSSGGCGAHVVYWIDRLIVSAVGFVTAPSRLWRGLQAGRSQANLYGMSARGALWLSTGELLKYVGI